MLKKLTVLFLLVGLSLAMEDSRKNENQMTKTLCSKIVTKQIEPKDQILMLTKCINQKHQSENSRSPRSVDLFGELFNIDNIIDQLKKLTTSMQTKKSIGNVMIGVTEIDLRPEMPNKIRCDSNFIRIESAVLSSKDFEAKCEQTRENANLNALNETCHDEQQALKIAIESCNGQKECELNVETQFEGVCDCTAKKYLKVAFSCVKPSEIQMSRNKRALFYRNDEQSIARDRSYRRSFGGIGDIYYDDYYYNYYNYFYPYDFYPYDFYPYDLYDYYPFYDYYGLVNPLAAKQKTSETAVEKTNNLRLKTLNLEVPRSQVEIQKPEEPVQSNKNKNFDSAQWKFNREALRQKLQASNKNRETVRANQVESNSNEVAGSEGKRSRGKFNSKPNKSEGRRKNTDEDSNLPSQSPRNQPRQGGAQGRRRQNEIFPNSNKFTNRHVEE